MRRPRCDPSTKCASDGRRGGGGAPISTNPGVCDELQYRKIRILLPRVYLFHHDAASDEEAHVHIVLSLEMNRAILLVTAAAVVAVALGLLVIGKWTNSD